jgi:hypothetical protein
MYQSGRILFEPKDLHIMESPHKRLNDICLNGISATLHTFFSKSTNPSSLSSRRCALFTTHDLPMVRYNASDADIWQRFRRSEYWCHDLWILPIHRTRPSLHWVLCVIYPHSRQLLLFDSFSDHLPWKYEIKVRLNIGSVHHPIFIICHRKSCSWFSVLCSLPTRTATLCTL